MSEMRKKAEELWNLWFGAKVTKTGPELLADALTDVAEQIRLEDAKAVCEHCANEDYYDSALKRDIWIHRRRSDGLEVHCWAYKIKGRLRKV